jgi:hypothetical protein
MRRSKGIANRDAMAALAPRLQSAFPHFCTVQNRSRISSHGWAHLGAAMNNMKYCSCKCQARNSMLLHRVVYERPQQTAARPHQGEHRCLIRVGLAVIAHRLHVRLCLCQRFRILMIRSST